MYIFSSSVTLQNMYSSGPVELPPEFRGIGSKCDFALL